MYREDLEARTLGGTSGGTLRQGREYVNNTTKDRSEQHKDKRRRGSMHVIRVRCKRQE